MRVIQILVLAVLVSISCKKSKQGDHPQGVFRLTALTVNGANNGLNYTRVNARPVLRFTFTDRIDRSTVPESVSFSKSGGTVVSFRSSLTDDDKTLVVEPEAQLTAFTKYTVTLSTTLKSELNLPLTNAISASLTTGIDSSDKFPRISADELMTLVQNQTFRYFYDFAHPVSGLARERNTSGDIVTSGGSGFGLMVLVTGINRAFITREEGLVRIKKVVGFLKNTAQTFHGAYPHWLNGVTGAAVAFSEKDNGADLVETSFLVQGLLTARQFFDGGSPEETTLRNDINEIWERVEWNWFRKRGDNVLYWHWSPDYGWEMNHPITGWNECLITYVLAASSATSPIPEAVYHEGWARNGLIRNGSSYYGTTLPLGPAHGGPLFFAHYSFLGIDPRGLSDEYASYWNQNLAHTLINYEYCVANPKDHYGYGEEVWGLTASDDNKTGYSAHSPDNDPGVISPTAALSSFPYTPEQSMAALEFFYYKLGDRIWKDYGFTDAFNLTDGWFADSFLAIDQGPVVVMIENYRTGLLWDLFMSCPEIKTGMTKLGFQRPGW